MSAGSGGSVAEPASSPPEEAGPTVAAAAQAASPAASAVGANDETAAPHTGWIKQHPARRASVA